MPDSDAVMIGSTTRNWLRLARDQVGRSDRGIGRSIWSLRVELHGEGLDAATSIWLGPDGVEERLDDFFGALATDWRGWDGTRSWLGWKAG